MTDLTTLRLEEERLEAELSEVRRSIEQLEGPELGNLPNKRAGFYHIHSNSYECGIAYRRQRMGDDEGWSWAKCSKLVNHEGNCGYEDNTAF